MPCWLAKTVAKNALTTNSSNCCKNKKARCTPGFFRRNLTIQMSAKYDANAAKHPKILRLQFGQNYDVKKSAYR
jgi:hypothetical protein